MAEADVEYEVEEILDKRIDKKNGIEYFIKWKGYGDGWYFLPYACF